MFFNITGNGPLFQTMKRRAIFRGVQAGSFAVAAVGQILAFDWALQSADTTSGYNPTPGTSKGNSATATVGLGGISTEPADLIWQSVVEPAAESDVVGNAYCIVTNLFQGAGATGTEIEVCPFGIVQANVASATYTRGDLLMMSATEANRNMLALTASTPDGQRPIARVITGGTSVTTATVMFWGGIGGMLAGQAITN